jgi:hypothetical protein
MKPKRFYALRIISVFYKALALILVLSCIGAVGYVSVQAIQSPLSDFYDFQTWVAQTLTLVVGGGMLSLTLYVLAQLIDVQISTHERLNEIAKALNKTVESTEKIAVELHLVHHLPSDMIWFAVSSAF